METYVIRNRSSPVLAPSDKNPPQIAFHLFFAQQKKPAAIHPRTQEAIKNQFMGFPPKFLLLLMENAVKNSIPIPSMFITGWKIVTKGKKKLTNPITRSSRTKNKISRLSMNIPPKQKSAQPKPRTEKCLAPIAATQSFRTNRLLYAKSRANIFAKNKNAPNSLNVLCDCVAKSSYHKALQNAILFLCLIVWPFSK